MTGQVVQLRRQQLPTPRVAACYAVRLTAYDSGELGVWIDAETAGLDEKLRVARLLREAAEMVERECS